MLAKQEHTARSRMKGLRQLAKQEDFDRHRVLMDHWMSRQDMLMRWTFAYEYAHRQDLMHREKQFRTVAESWFVREMRAVVERKAGRPAGASQQASRATASPTQHNAAKVLQRALACHHARQELARRRLRHLQEEEQQNDTELRRINALKEVETMSATSAEEEGDWY